THTAILIDAVTFFGSALVILFIRTGEENKTYEKINASEYFDTLKGGFYYLKKNQIILNFVLLAMVANALLIPLNSLQAPLVKELLQQGEYMLSLLSFSITIGLGVGSAFYPFIAKRMSTRLIVLFGGISLSFYYFILVLCGYFSTHVIVIYLICTASSFLTGAVLSLLTSALSVQFMKQVEPEYLARAGAILSAGCVGAMPIVSFIIGFLTKLISLPAIFYGISGIGMAFFIFVYIKKVRFE
ncbi:MAG: transporter, partial [Herbinix sp.]|nr:transporter [Herbinix sp.]